MIYCRVIIETPTRGQVYKKDFEVLNIFGPLVRIFVGALVSEGAVTEGEPYRSLIYPAYTEALNPDPMLTLDPNKASEDYPAWINVICVDNGAHANAPLTYFTMELRFQESGLIYRHDLPILNLSYFWKNLQTALLNMNVLQDGDTYYPRLYVCDDTNADFEHEEVSTITDTNENEPLLVEIVTVDDSGPDFPLRARDTLSVIDTEEVQLVSVGSSQTAGDTGQDTIQIFITKDTYETLQTIAQKDVQVEQGGMLVGDIFRNANNPDHYLIVITDHVFAEGTSANLVELRYTFDSWLKGSAQVKARFPGKRIVGWYHTHLIKMPVQAGDSDEIASTDLFFSQDDRFMHRQFFNDKWYVAMVLGQQGNAVFFRWFDNAISANQRFYVIERENITAPPDTPTEDA